MPGGTADRNTLAKGPSGRCLCRWCNLEVPLGRQTFCSEFCVEEWKLRSNPGHLRDRVFERDRGICATCGVDCMRELWHIKRLRGMAKAKAVANWGLGSRKTLWDADHIIPVVDGGGECDLSNMQTLCLKCHRIRTAELRLRLRAALEKKRAPTVTVEKTVAAVAATSLPAAKNDQSVRSCFTISCMRQVMRFLLLWAVPLAASLHGEQAHQTTRDRDLLEVSVPQLEKFYSGHKYTVTQVVNWYLERIEKYNGIYRAIQTVDAKGALATAAAEDAAAKQQGRTFKGGPLWGVPVVIKANTSVRGLITTDGWQGYMIPGHELIAPKDATVVTKLRAAGAVILGQANMPDFAASDTNRSTAFGRTGNAYDVRFSPGGSSGGTVTAVTANFAVLGTGTDTSNSIRMPSSTSAVVGVLPTRGLVSIAGIAPLDWLLDNTGPIARSVGDAAIALGVMAGEDSGDFRTAAATGQAETGPYTPYLKTDALKGKRFGVPAFIVKEAPPSAAANRYLTPETRAMFTKTVEALRAAGATVVIDDSILPDSFTALIRAIDTRPYRLDGTQTFLREYGAADYHSAEDYAKAVGSPLPNVITGLPGANGSSGQPPVEQTILKTDPAAEANFFAPQRHALEAYLEPFDRLHLDGLVYPAAQMPPPDETMPQDGRLSSGPHSNTGWVNRIGVPAIVVSGGFYPSGLPFGLEFSARPWKDGELLGWAYAYEQATKYRRPPVLVDKGLLPTSASLR